MKEQQKEETNQATKEIQVIDKGIDLDSGTRDAVCCVSALSPVR